MCRWCYLPISFHEMAMGKSRNIDHLRSYPDRLAPMKRCWDLNHIGSRKMARVADAYVQLQQGETDKLMDLLWYDEMTMPVIAPIKTPLNLDQIATVNDRH